MALAASAVMAMMMTTALAAPSATCPKAKAATTALTSADLQSKLSQLLGSGTLGTCPKSADLQALLAKFQSACTNGNCLTATGCTGANCVRSTCTGNSGAVNGTTTSSSTCPFSAASKTAALKALLGQ